MHINMNAGIDRQIAVLEDIHLYGLRKKLEAETELTDAQSELLRKIIVEVEDRAETNARREFTERDSMELVEFIKNIKSSRMSGVDRVRYGVATDVLIERHTDLAKRADAYLEKNNHLQWDNAFFGLIAHHTSKQQA